METGSGDQAIRSIEYSPIGYITTPFDSLSSMPIQPGAGKGIKGKIELLAQYTEGLKDLEGFSHIILIYHMHLAKGYKLKVTPFLDPHERGLFATRAPKRPNPIGISIVRLEKIERNVLHISDIDVLNRTPLLDLKPHIPDFDSPGNVRTGWYKQNQIKRGGLSDNRFSQEE